MGAMKDLMIEIAENMNKGMSLEDVAYIYGIDAKEQIEGNDIFDHTRDLLGNDEIPF